MTISLAVSIAIFLAIAIRQWLPGWIRIWQIMLAGAVVLILVGEISPVNAFKAIDWNVIFYLFGVFAIASALYDSGFPNSISARIAGGGSSLARTLLLILAVTVPAAIMLTNDAAAVIGTPIALSVAVAHRIHPSVPLAALCVFVTLAGMMSPVGNPQNILITADGHFSNAIGTFALWTAIPALLSLAFAYAWLLFCLRRELHTTQGLGSLPNPSGLRRWPAMVSIALLAVLILGDSLLHEIEPRLDLPLGAMALIACLPIFLFTPRRLFILRDVDWYTLIFFVAMFVVTGSLLKSGSLQAMLGSWQDRLNEPTVITGISYWGSQLFSNVPLVEIYLNLLKETDTATLMLLAAMSTLAGNLFVISAASNVIIVQQAEKFGAEPFTFWRFTGLVLPVSVVSVAVSYVWIVEIMPHIASTG